ncbi:MAG: carboxypeptidase-like regulatory domain-containing protein [Bacteroidales bacterium]|nr:carboxypeptidase-like regulatory domain-containing protein [Bacteroidales bacterium]
MKNLMPTKQLSIITIMLLIFNLNYAGSVVSGQNRLNSNSFLTIEGKVIDKKTKKPMVFVTVSAVGTNIGTVTNTEGKFTINIDNSLNIKQLSFKYIGYKNKYVNVETISENNVVIKMQPFAVPIEEVIVRPNNPKELIAEILKKIPENYNNNPNKMIAFYRETIKKKKKYVSISEAVVEVYKAEYDKPLSSDLVKLYKGRKSSNVKSQDTIIMKLRGGPKTALLLDVAKNPDIIFYKDNMGSYKFEINEITTINDKQNYVIAFTQVKNPEYPLFNGKLYVNVKTLAITAAEFELNLENKEAASRLFVRKKPLFMSIVPVTTKYFVKYKEDSGKYYFAHARGEVTFKCNWKAKVFNSKYTVMTEIAITDKTDKNVVKFTRAEQLKAGIVFEEKVRPFGDEDFWGKYNTIKPEESIENTIKKYGVILKIQNN